MTYMINLLYDFSIILHQLLLLLLLLVDMSLVEGKHLHMVYQFAVN